MHVFRMNRRLPRPYGEPLSDARTPLAVFSRILLGRGTRGPSFAEALGSSSKTLCVHVLALARQDSRCTEQSLREVHQTRMKSRGLFRLLDVFVEVDADEHAKDAQDVDFNIES